MTNPDILNSWKEVAGYLGRGVRTVQRWEHDLGLPVRRPRGKARSAIIAMRSELDLWLQDAHGEVPDPVPGGNFSSANRLHNNTSQLIVRTQQLLNRSTELCERMKDMQDKVSRALELTATQVRHNLQLRNSHHSQSQSRLPN